MTSLSPLFIFLCHIHKYTKTNIGSGYETKIFKEKARQHDNFVIIHKNITVYKYF